MYKIKIIYIFFTTDGSQIVGPCHKVKGRTAVYSGRKKDVLTMYMIL